MSENILPVVVLYLSLLFILISAAGFWVYSASKGSKTFRLVVQTWTLGGGTLAFGFFGVMTVFYGFLAPGQNTGLVEVLMLTFLGAALCATIAGFVGLLLRI